MSDKTIIVFRNPYYFNTTQTPSVSSTNVRLGIYFFVYDSNFTEGYDPNSTPLYVIEDYHIQTSLGENIIEINNDEETSQLTPSSSLESIFLFLNRKSIVYFRNELYGIDNQQIITPYHVRVWYNDLETGTGSITQTLAYDVSTTNSINYNGPGLNIVLGVEDADSGESPPYFYYATLYNICFHSETLIELEGGVTKLVKDLKQGDMLMTDEGPKPLSKLIKSTCSKAEFIKISKDSFGENVPSSDLLLTPDHPLGLSKEKTENGNKYTHLSLKELVNNVKGMDYVVVETDNLYNLVFDDQYVVNIQGLRVLSHHPNHENGKFKLEDKDVMNEEDKSQLTYVDHDNKYFNFMTFKQLMSQKPENMKGSEHLRNSVKF